jgi:predicted nucleic acid-binding protein
MGALPPTNQWALDTNVLIDLALGENGALELLEVFQENGCRLFVAPVVVRELAAFSAFPSGPIASAARKAVTSLRQTWDIEPFSLSSVEMTLANLCRDDLLARCIVPTQERNDAHLIAQVALKNISLLVSSDHHLKNIDLEALTAALNARSLGPLAIVAPEKVVRFFDHRQ